ncbi:ATP synthase subunit I [Bordetella genomosp. 11]|nr:ATP synthase subunit I [Bordetella genomosp. 11]
MTELINDSNGLPPDGETRLVLSAEQKAALRARTSRGLARAVVAQCVMAVLATVIAWVVAGTAAGLSALVGAGAYLVPNTLFALRLLLDTHRPGQVNPFTFFLGEAFKLVATVLLLWLAVRLGGDRIVWPAMLIGLICTLKGYVLLLMSGKLS